MGKALAGVRWEKYLDIDIEFQSSIRHTLRLERSGGRCKLLPLRVSHLGIQRTLRRCVNFKVFCFSAGNRHRWRNASSFWGSCGSSRRKWVWKCQDLAKRRRLGRQVHPPPGRTLASVGVKAGPRGLSGPPSRAVSFLGRQN